MDLNFASFFWCMDDVGWFISIFHLWNESVCVYRSGSGIGDLSSVNLPFGSGALDFHIRSFKGLLHNRQGIAAHCRGLYIFPGRQCRQWDKKQNRALATVNPDMLSVDRCLSSCMQFTVMQKPLCYFYISYIHNTAAPRGKLFNARMWDLYHDSVCDVRKGNRIDYCLICICILKQPVDTHQSKPKMP